MSKTGLSQASAIFFLALSVLLASLLIEVVYFRSVLHKTVAIEAESALNFLEARITAYVETLELLPEVPDYLKDLAWLTDELQSQPHLIGVIVKEKGKILLDTFPTNFEPPPEVFERCQEGLTRGRVRYLCRSFEALPDRRFFLLLGVDISFEEEAFRNLLLLSSFILLAGSALLAAGLYYVQKLSRRQEELERRLSASEKLAAMGKIAAMVAHEIRNPLNSIVMALQYMAETKNLSPDLLKTINQEARKLTELTEELLSYTRGFETRPETVEARELLEELALRFKPKAQSLGLDFEIEEPPRAFFRADKRWCLRAIENLLRNAFEAVGPGGKVVLRAKEKGSFLCFEVEDNGPGIPEKLRPEVFQPFFTTKESGFGLGLYLVRKIAEAHGGRVSLRSSPLGGALFELCFPAVKDEKGQDPPG